MMSRCFIEFHISGLEEPMLYKNLVKFTRTGGGSFIRFWTAVEIYLEKFEGTLPSGDLLNPFFMKPNLPLPIPALVFISLVITFG